jgi:hypothetical protein
VKDTWRTWTDLALLAADTDRTQDYVFESIKLPEIRGASRQLDDLNSQIAEQVEARQGIVIYADGGSLLAFVRAADAQALAEEIDRTYPAQTTVATITVDWRTIDRTMVEKGYPEDSDAPFGALVRWAGTWLRRQKESRTHVPFIPALSHVERCRSCRTRPANPVYLSNYPEWPLCNVCHAKRAYRGRDAWFRQFQTYLQDNRQQAHKYYQDASRFPPFNRGRDLARWTPQDLNEIGQACQGRPGYVGLLYLDGDNMGEVFESFAKPEDYQTFSDMLRRVTKTAVMEALATHLNPAWVVPSDARPSDERPAHAEVNAHGQMAIHPFDIVAIGGDDVVVITPADAALPVASHISRSFTMKMRAAVAKSNLPDPFKQRAYTMSGGAVLADDHNPVRVLLDLAKQLTRTSKRARRLAGAQEGFLDFWVLTSADMLESRVADARRGYPYVVEQPGAKPLYLQGRPYASSTLASLWQGLAVLRRNQFPKSQLQQLAESLLTGRYESTLFYQYQAARDRQGAMDALTKILENVYEPQSQTEQSSASITGVPWYPVEHYHPHFSYQTALWDVAELYNFV